MMKRNVRRFAGVAAALTLTFACWGCKTSSHTSTRSYEYNSEPATKPQEQQRDTLGSDARMVSPGQMTSPGQMVNDPE